MNSIDELEDEVMDLQDEIVDKDRKIKCLVHVLNYIGEKYSIDIVQIKCQLFHIQDCDYCQDFDCGDNTNPNKVENE